MEDDNLIGRLIGGVLVLIVIGAILRLIYYLCLLVFTDIIVVADKLLGAWRFLPPYLSWAAVGFISVTLLHFAIKESGKLSRPAVKPVLVVLTILFILLPAFL